MLIEREGYADRNSYHGDHNDYRSDYYDDADFSLSAALRFALVGWACLLWCVRWFRRRVIGTGAFVTFLLAYALSRLTTRTLRRCQSGRVWCRLRVCWGRRAVVLADTGYSVVGRSVLYV